MGRVTSRDRPRAALSLALARSRAAREVPGVAIFASAANVAIPLLWRIALVILMEILLFAQVSGSTSFSVVVAAIIILSAIAVVVVVVA